MPIINLLTDFVVANEAIIGLLLSALGRLPIPFLLQGGGLLKLVEGLLEGGSQLLPLTLRVVGCHLE